MNFIAAIFILLLGISQVFGDCSSFAGSALRTVNVATKPELTSAIAAALPGDLIELADGTYSGATTITASNSRTGTSAAPIVLCGSSGAILSLSGISSGIALNLNAVHYWIIHGISLTNAQRGLQLNGASFNILSNLTITNTGTFGINVLDGSKNNTIRFSTIRNVGAPNSSNGKGIYIGKSATKDESDNNLVYANSFGPSITSEHVDSREGTTGNNVIENTFDGTGIAVQQLIGVRGNNMLIKGNTINYSMQYGAKTVPFNNLDIPYGVDNVFDGNYINIPPPSGNSAVFAGIYLSNPSVNTILCNNVVDPPEVQDFLSGGGPVQCSGQGSTTGTVTPPPTNPPTDPPTEPPTSAPGTTTAPTDPPTEPPTSTLPPRSVCDEFSNPDANRYDVSTFSELATAIANVEAGDLIVLADGTYTGNTRISGVSGIEGGLITLCGSANAILQVDDLTSSNGLQLTGVQYWRFYGFTVTRSRRGIQLASSSDNIFDHLTIDGIGNHGIYIYQNSPRNIIRNSIIRDCGSQNAGVGKGIYIGTSGGSDASDGNIIHNNRFGPLILAEAIDFREGTFGTQIYDNWFNGTDIRGQSSATQVISARGSCALIKNNQIFNSYNFAFKSVVNAAVNGSGNFNVFDGNYMDLAQGPNIQGGISIGTPTGTGAGNVVLCNNVLVNAGSFPMTNKACVASLPANYQCPAIITPPDNYTESWEIVPPFPTFTNNRTCDSFDYTRRVPVTTATELHSALSGAQAGDVIVIAPGQYVGQFLATGISGTSDKWIVLCGVKDSVLTVGDVTVGSALEVHNAKYWYLSGFTTSFAKKALQFEGVSNSVIDGLYAHHIGDEAIHVKLNSSYNIVQNNLVQYTGMAPLRRGFGEGIYIGSSINTIANDFSDYNTLRYNWLGPNVTAEGMDIKEFTTGTWIYNNTFNGIGLSGENSAWTLCALKGNYALVQNNRFYHSIQYATRTSIVVQGWGDYNVFDGNEINLPRPRVIGGIYIHNPLAGGQHNVVLCNNKVEPANVTAFVPKEVFCVDSYDFDAASSASSAAASSASVSSSSSSTGGSTGSDATSGGSNNATSGSDGSTSGSDTPSSTFSPTTTGGTQVNESTDPCVASVSFNQRLQSQWHDGVSHFTNWFVTIVASEPLYSLRFTLSPPEGSYVQNYWQITRQQDGSFTHEDWRLQSGQSIPAGTTVSFGYIVSSSSPAKITTRSALCEADCAVSASQSLVTSWSDGSVFYKQYSFGFTNRGIHVTKSVALTLLLPSGALPTQYWSLTTSDSVETIMNSERVLFTAPVWGLAPSASHSGSHGYTIALPLAQSGEDPLFEVTDFVCQ